MYLLEIQNIKGLATVGRFKDCIKLATFEVTTGREGEQVVVGSGKRNTGLRRCSPIYVTRMLDHNSIDIIQNAVNGKPYDAKIHILGNNEEYFVIELQDCLINQHKMSAHGEVPLESFYLTFASIHYRSTPPGVTPRGASLNLLTGE